MANTYQDIGAPFIVNGMGEIDKDGSYISVVVTHKNDEFRHEYLISEGQAENLAAELTDLVLKMHRARLRREVG